MTPIDAESFNDPQGGGGILPLSQIYGHGNSIHPCISFSVGYSATKGILADIQKNLEKNLYKFDQDG